MSKYDVQALQSVTSAVGAGDANESQEPAVRCFDHDLPPESFWLSRDEEYEWFDRNAFLGRNDSTKGNFCRVAGAGGSGGGSDHNHRRFSVNLKSKASIIRLPKPQKAAFLESKRKNSKQGKNNKSLFTKRTETPPPPPVKSAISEPGSPLVSCIGRVRSTKRGRRKSNSGKRKDKSGEKSRSSEKEKQEEKPHFFSIVLKILRFKNNTLRNRSESMKTASKEPSSAPPAPSLGAAKRLASQRWRDDWTAEV